MESTKDNLEELNRKIINAKDNKSAILSYSEKYFEYLRKYLPQTMKAVADEDDGQKNQELLRSIFQMQRALMNIRVVAGKEIDSDLWEVAEDFDNDDPDRYGYLTKKIKEKKYLLQG